MTTLSRLSWALCGAVLMAGACGGSRIGGGGTGGFGTGGSPDNFGGYPSTGGFPLTGGVPGTGGVAGYQDGYGGWPSTGGFPGIGGAAGYNGTGGTSQFPDGGTCSSPSRGPITTLDAPRPFGWTFTAGTLETSAADGGTGPAHCQSVPAAYPGVRCVGTAYLKGTATGPAIVFADGSLLSWDGTLPNALAPTAGSTVTVDYERKNTVVCPFCGVYTTSTLLIRDDSGQIVFYDQQGTNLPNLPDSLATEIFGVSATAIQTCTYPVFGGCYTFLRSEFDHQLATSPAQTITDATLSMVTTPNGKFAVIWASSTEEYVVKTDGCTNGPGVATDTGFVASRLSP